jgi:hypothetical protein
MDDDEALEGLSSPAFFPFHHGLYEILYYAHIDCQ